MKKIVLISLMLASSFVSVDAGSDLKSFYEFQNTGKLIDKLQSTLITDKAEFVYGFQPYNQQNIVNTTCFYNQPSNILHYILTNDQKHTLHFQISLLEVDHVNQVNVDHKDKHFFELVYKDQSGMKVKEHNEKGGIIFSLRFTSFQIPVPSSVDMDNMIKLVNKILKKANKYQS